MLGLRRRRRERLRRRELPAAWVEVIERNVPYYRTLNPQDRRELHGHIQVFLAEKHFEGCGGLEITDEIRVTIAAQACILLLHRDTDYYARLRTILVYPDTYVADVGRRVPGGIRIEGREVRLGESWVAGAIVLSWDAVVRGAADVHDGHNVVFHEFAHQLDAESGGANGAPPLPRRSQYIAWVRVMKAEYEHLLADIARHRDTVLDGYGGTNPAEFFAVATECFFEKSLELRERHPALYEQLRLFYRQDPAAGAAEPPRD
jgi:Mlc titration factor MtfA (ptsG expression regulator)